MEKFIFTFGVGTPLGNRCQPIIASSYGQAREKMFEIYGSKWCGQYDEAHWKDVLSRVYVKISPPTPLDAITCEEVRPE